MTDAEMLKAHYEDFTESRPVPDGFEERMEAAGLMEFRAVTDEDLEQSFATDNGIEKGGMCWALTPAGEAIFNSEP